MASIADLVKTGMQAEAAATGDKGLAREANGNSNLERLMQQVAKEDGLDLAMEDDESAELRALRALWDEEQAASRHGQSEQSIMDDFDAFARDLGRTTGIGPEEAYLGVGQQQPQQRFAMPETPKRGPGRPRKSAPPTPVRDSAFSPRQQQQANDAPPPKTAAEVRAEKESVLRRKYIKKLEYAFRVSSWRERLERVVKPPRNEDWNSLNFAQAEAAYQAVCAELDDIDPEPWVTSVMTRGAYLLENVAPYVGSAVGLEAHHTNLSHPISLGATVQRGTADTNSPMADSIRRLTLLYVGEWQSGPLTTALMGLLQTVTAVAAANAAIAAQQGPAAHQQDAGPPMPDYSELMTAAPAVSGEGHDQTEQPQKETGAEPEKETHGEKKRGRPRKKKE